MQKDNDPRKTEAGVDKAPGTAMDHFSIKDKTNKEKVKVIRKGRG